MGRTRRGNIECEIMDTPYENWYTYIYIIYIGYKLPINAQNCMQTDSTQAKISLKVVGGYFFDSPCSFISSISELKRVVCGKRCI